MNAIHEASERAKQAFNALKDKFEMQKTHALAALDGCAAFPGGGSLVVALCVSQLLNYGDLFEPWVIDWDTNILETLPDMTEMPSFIAADPLFWYIVITQLLHNRGAFDGSAVRSWVPQLLANAILHPKRVGRMPVPREADRARAALAKHIAPMLVGFHSFDDDAKAVFNGTLSSEQILALFAGHLANVIDSSDPTQPCFRNKAHRKAFNFFWLNLVGPNREEIMQWLASSSQFVSLPDESSKDDPVEAIQTPSGDGELDAELVAQESDETPPIHCFYVTNPAASELQLIEAPIPTDAGDASDFAKFLRAQGVSKAVKAISIAHALEFFRTMPEMSRTLRPHETVGCQTWHKLKRGRIRIYVRMESDERILFHVYQRKDWKPNGLAA